MKHKIYIFLFALVLMLSFGGFEQIFATRCERLTACERFATADLIFVGKYKDVSQTVKTEGKFFLEKYNSPFEVSEIFWGTEEDVKKVVYYSAGFSSKKLIAGEQYLIYAYKNSQGTFSTRMCSTLPIENAEEHLSFLRNVPAQLRQGSRISGVAELSFYEPSYKPLTINIQQTDGDKKFIKITPDEKGNFGLNNIPKGKYLITPVFAELSIKNLFPDYEFEISGRGCYNADIYLGKNNDGFFYYFE